MLSQQVGSCIIQNTLPGAEITENDLGAQPEMTLKNPGAGGRSPSTPTTPWHTQDHHGAMTLRSWWGKVCVFELGWQDMMRGRTYLVQMVIRVRRGRSAAMYIDCWGGEIPVWMAQPERPVLWWRR